MIYIFFVFESIPVSVTGSLKSSSGLEKRSAHTVTEHKGGIGRSHDPNRSASFFVTCLYAHSVKYRIKNNYNMELS